MPGHQTLSDLIHSTFTTVPLQLFATVAALVALAAIGFGVRALGSPLKERLDDALVESIQAGFVAVFTALIGLFLISVWQATGLVQKGFEQIDPNSRTVVATVLSIAVLAGAYSLTRVTKNSIRRLSQERGAITDYQQEVAHHIVQILIFVFAVLVVFGIWGVKPGNLLVGASVATVIVGLAARQTLGAVLAGFVVLFSRPFELGDWVVIGDNEGIVTDISIVNTQIRTFDEEYVMIPNDIVTDTEVTNRSRKGRLRLETDVGVDYTTDVERAMEVATDAMAETETPLERPEPHVVLAEFSSSSVVLRLRYFIDNPSSRKRWKARTEVIAAVKDAFEAEGIKIPFPQRELTGREEAGGLAVSGVSAGGAADGPERIERRNEAADSDADTTPEDGDERGDDAESRADGDDDTGAGE
ncbi:MAG: mechanosensitive ion channel family protein [Halolamina sp.]